MSSIFLFIALSFCLSWLVKIAYSVWWRPIWFVETFRKQGIHGFPYKLVAGNTREKTIMTQKALSKPMSLSHDIVPRVIPFYNEAFRKYGSIAVTWYGRIPELIVTDPEMVKEILLDKLGRFHKPPLAPLEKLLALGIVNMDGERWTMQRRLLNPAFHMEKLKGMLPSVSHSCHKLVQAWEKLIEPQGSCELDVWPYFWNLAGDVVSSAGFSSSLEEGRLIFQMQSEQAHLVVEAIQTNFIPGMRFLPTKKNRMRKELSRKVILMLNNIIDKREKEMKLGMAKNHDLLGLMLEANDLHQQHGGKGITRDDIIEECKLFYFAGQDTTSVMLTWAMVLLSMYPDWQARAREEVLQVCGKQTPSFDSLSHLKTLTMIINETMRLYPPACLVSRITTETVKLGGYTLPAGVRLMIPILLLHRDPKVWGDDANEFKPERFSAGISNATNNQLAFLPFSWGPRICIGNQFALIEGKLALAMILQRFSFELSPSYTHAPHLVVTLQPQYGAQIILRPV